MTQITFISATKLNHLENTRAFSVSLDPNTAEILLSSRLGNTPLSFAELSALGDGLGGAHYLRADPVHLEADLSQVYLRGNTGLDLSASELDFLVEELNQHLQKDQLKLIAVNAKRWYLQATQKIVVDTHAWMSCVNQAITNYLPRDPDRHWERLFTELQMILHASKINQQRRQAGKPTLDALWFFGSAPLEGLKQSAEMVAELWTDSPWAKGLALYHKIPVMDLKALNPLKLQDKAKILIHSENNEMDGILQDLLLALSEHRVASIEVYPLNGKRYQIKKPKRWFKGLRQCWKKN